MLIYPVIQEADPQHTTILHSIRPKTVCVDPGLRLTAGTRFSDLHIRKCAPVSEAFAWLFLLYLYEREHYFSFSLNTGML